MTCCSPSDNKETCCAVHSKTGGKCNWGCTSTGTIVAGVLAAIVMYVFECFWHGQYLMPIYELTPNIWRPFADMEQLRIVSLGMTLALAMGLSFIFSMNYENRGIGEGVRFGIAMGVVLGVVQSMAFLYLPISINLATLWLLGWIVEGVLVGVALALAHIAFQKQSKT